MTQPLSNEPTTIGPPDGPSEEALEAFARAVEQGLREVNPGWDFKVRRRRRPPTSSAPDDADAVS